MAQGDPTSEQAAVEGAQEAAHLVGGPVPNIPLLSTRDRWVNLDEQPGWVVVYCYPMTGRPDEPSPPGWDDIFGARGCTVETCAFRDILHQLRELDTQVFGLSTQTTDYQKEMVERLGVTFEVLSDADLRLTKALRLPTFSLEGQTYLRRLTTVLAHGRIDHVFYPIDHPAEHPKEVLGWLRKRRRLDGGGAKRQQPARRR